MRIVLAIDSFKGCLSSTEAESAAAEGAIINSLKNEIVKIPVSDGGEGMLDCFDSILDSENVFCEASDPLLRPIGVPYGIAEINAGNGVPVRTAIIETAKAIGLTIISEDERAPLETSSYGIGQIILDALDKGCTSIIMGLGGSSTNDAGVGMMQALGYSFYSHLGFKLNTASGKDLAHIGRIDASGADPRLASVSFTIASDVTNPLFGDNGATMVFSAQKGASASISRKLESGMLSYASVFERFLNAEGNAKHGTGFSTSVPYLPGAGAAGGIGSALLGYLNGKMESGIGLLLGLADFDRIAASADIIITGEGRADMQTLMGKVPYGILERVRKGKPKVGLVDYSHASFNNPLSVSKTPVVMIAGQVRREAASALRKAGFADVVCINPPLMPLHEAMQPDVAKANIARTVAEILSGKSRKTFSA